jgi:hypothetical protein
LNACSAGKNGQPFFPLEPLSEHCQPGEIRLGDGIMNRKMGVPAAYPFNYRCADSEDFRGIRARFSRVGRIEAAGCISRVPA